MKVNHINKYPKYDPFVLAYQAQQVYFAPYPSIKRDKDHWWVVFQMKARSMVDPAFDKITFQEEMVENPPQLAELHEDDYEVAQLNGIEDVSPVGSEEEEDFVSESSTDDEEVEFDSSTTSGDTDDYR